MTENDPTFAVERTDGVLELIPEFQPSALDDDDRELYDNLRETLPARDGAIGLPKPMDARFVAGETVTLREVYRELGEQAHEVAEAAQSAMIEMARTLAPAAKQLADAMEPLTELKKQSRKEMGLDGDRPEDG